MKKIPVSTLEKWMCSENFGPRFEAMKACALRFDIPLDLIKKGLDDSNEKVREVAVRALSLRSDVPITEIANKVISETSDAVVRRMIGTLITFSNEVPLEYIIKFFDNGSPRFKKLAMILSRGRHDVPVSLIIAGLKDSSDIVRHEAILHGCYHRDDIPTNLLEHMFCHEKREYIKTAVSEHLNWLSDVGLNVPTIRTVIIPADHVVYKKCEHNVIVGATIPADAQIRGCKNGKCRASKAKIVEVIGDTYGENFGVSLFDSQTIYEVGDEIVIEDFDMSSRECGAGFHFFLTKEEAECY